jgi:glutaredoxin
MIKFYSTGCPQCNQIKAMMDSKGIEYEYITDIDEIMNVADKHNIKSAPFAEVFDEIMTASTLIKYINTKQ